MVNRVLIRLKVVQLLYSYLLSKSDFKIEMPQHTSSPDRRYAYSAYPRLLLLILELSGINVARKFKFNPGETISSTRFYKTKFAIALSENADVRTLIDEYADSMREFDDLLTIIISKLRNLPAYRAFQKVKPDNTTPSDEIDFWKTALRAITKMPEIEDIFHKEDDFTTRGFEMAVKMVDLTLNTYGDSRNLLVNCRKDLQRSMDEAYNLYHWLLWLPVEITNTENNRLEANAHKYLPSEEDLHPDRRFVDAKIIDALTGNPQLIAFLNEKGISWHEDLAIIPRLSEMVISSEPYKQFMEKPGEKTIEEEFELWRALLKQIILPSDDLAESLENKSIFWNDDIDIMGSFAIKTLRKLSINPFDNLLPEFKDDEDAEFGKKLFNAAVTNNEYYRNLIDEFIDNSKWDADRIALMDVVILETALAETLTFPNIPLTVTANEYVEIANWYSTSRSGAFINGMFASISDKLRNEGKLIKNFN